MADVKAEDIIGIDYAIQNHPDVNSDIENDHEELHAIHSHTDVDEANGADIDELASGNSTTLHRHENLTIEGGGF